MALVRLCAIVLLFMAGTLPAQAQDWRDAAIAKVREGHDAYDQGRFFDAIGALKEAYETLRQHEPDSSLTLGAASYLAGAYHMQGSYEEEEPLQRLVLEGSRKLDPDSGRTLGAALALAGALIELGKTGEAETVLDEARRISLLPAATRTEKALVQMYQARRLSASHRYDEASVLFEDACNQLTPGGQAYVNCIRESAINLEYAGSREEAERRIAWACGFLSQMSQQGGLQGGGAVVYQCYVDNASIMLGNGSPDLAHGALMILMGATRGSDEFGAVITRGMAIMALASEASNNFDQAYGEWNAARVQAFLLSCNDHGSDEDADCSDLNSALILARAGEARMLTDHRGEHGKAYSLASDANRGIWARNRRPESATLDDQRRQELIGNRENFMLQIRSGWRWTHPR